MTVAVLTLRLHAPWAHSLKEKRMELRSILTRVRGKFNVSAAEIGEQDAHQILAVGVAAIAADRAQADSILDHVIAFVEMNTEAELLSVEREIR